MAETVDVCAGTLSFQHLRVIQRKLERAERRLHLVFSGGDEDEDDVYPPTTAADAVMDALAEVVRTHSSRIHGLDFEFVDTVISEQKIAHVVSRASGCLTQLAFFMRTAQGATAIFQAAAAPAMSSCLEKLTIRGDDPDLVQLGKEHMAAIVRGLALLPNLAETNFCFGEYTDATLSILLEGVLVHCQAFVERRRGEAERSTKAMFLKLSNFGALTGAAKVPLTEFLDQLPTQWVSLSLTLGHSPVLFSDVTASRAFVDVVAASGGAVLSELILMEVGITPDWVTYLFQSLQQHRPLETLRLHDVRLLQPGDELDRLMKAVASVGVKRLHLVDIPGSATPPLNAAANTRLLWDESQWSHVLEALWQNTTIVEASFFIYVQDFDEDDDETRMDNQDRIDLICTRNQDISMVQKQTIRGGGSVETWLQALARMGAKPHGATPAYMVVRAHLCSWLQTRK